MSYYIVRHLHGVNPQTMSEHLKKETLEIFYQGGTIVYGDIMYPTNMFECVGIRVNTCMFVHASFTIRKRHESIMYMCTLQTREVAKVTKLLYMPDDAQGAKRFINDCTIIIIDEV